MAYDADRVSIPGGVDQVISVLVCDDEKLEPWLSNGAEC